MKKTSLKKAGHFLFLLLIIFNVFVGSIHHVVHSEEFFHTEHHHHDFHKSDKHFCENEAKFDCDLDLFIHHQEFLSLDNIYSFEIPKEIIDLNLSEFIVSNFQTQTQSSFLRGPPALS